MIVQCEQYSSEYWDARRAMPTASEFHRIVTPKKMEYAAGATTYAIELIAELYDYNYGMAESCVTAAMRNGTLFEPRCRAFYEMERNVDVTRVGFCISDCGRFGASPDALIGDDGGLELKHPTAATHIKWLLAGVVPPEHLAQCHGGLLVTKRHWWDFLSWYPGLPPLLVRVVPDDYTLRLAKALEQFWTEFTAMRARIEGGRDEIVAAAMANAGVVEPYF
jgi:hypothetical protein